MDFFLRQLALGDVDHGAMKMQCIARRVAFDPPLCLQPADLSRFWRDLILDVIMPAGLNGTCEGVDDTRLVLIHDGPEIILRGQAFCRRVWFD